MMLSKSKLKRWYIKSTSWEYWPMWMVYFPSSFYYVYLALRARSFFFFSASNPSIENGGMLYESKWKIYNLIPKSFYPNTLFVAEAEPFENLQKKLASSAISYPFIAKPDIGGRGLGVKKIASEQELRNYREAVRVSFLIQEFVDYPIELSVFYFRKPGSKKGKITSLTMKELLTVIGDGKSNLNELIRKNDRAFLQLEKLKSDPRINLNEIPAKDKKVLLVPYGNHVLGAMFLNYNHLIDDALTARFDSISKEIKGFYFGRFDLRCSNLEDLKNGINFSILELNGAGAEPAHIYDPNFSYFKAQNELKNYYKNMYQASAENHKRGVPYMKYKDFRMIRKLEKEYKSKITI